MKSCMTCKCFHFIVLAYAYNILLHRLLSQAWSPSPIDSITYFHKWARTRYANAQEGDLPKTIYQTSDVLLRTVYSNTDLVSAFSVTKSIFELAPNETGLLESPSHIPTKIMYDPSSLVSAWQSFLSAADILPTLRSNMAYQLDLLDITRQVLANAFYPMYSAFLTHTNITAVGVNDEGSLHVASQVQLQMLSLLATLDNLLRYTPSKSPESSLFSWVNAARSWAGSNNSMADTMARNAINQVTLWGPNGELSDYASHQWSGLIGAYYLPRWQMFTDAYLNAFRSRVPVNPTSLRGEILAWEKDQQEGVLVENMGDLRNAEGSWDMVKGIEEEWCGVLGC